jgi:3-oxoadipate enol-lactonase
MNGTIPRWRESGEGPAGTEGGSPRRGVVLLHGLCGDGALWAPTLPALRGFRALAWDMPGYGGSAPAGPAGEPLLGEAGVPALAAALARLLDAAGLEAADLVGHSIGGMVAQEFAATWPERVRSLVLYASPPAFGGRSPAFREAFLAARLAPLDAGLGMAGVAAALLPGLLGEAPHPAALAAALASMAAIPEAGYRAALAALVDFDRRADLGRIAVPTLVVFGEADPMAPFPVMHGMAGAIPDARLGIIANAGHLAHLERPAEFNAVLREFLVAQGEA